MHRMNANKLLALASLLTVVASGSVTAACAGDKPIDWNKKLEKERQLYVTNNIEEAEKILRDYLHKHPESGACHTDMGKCLKRRGNLTEAKSEFQRSTEVEPNYADGWYELGAMQQSDKEWQEAIDSFERYLQVEPYSARKGAVKDRIAECKNNL